MFEQTFIDTRGRTRRSWTVALSLLFQITLVAIALAAPLLRVAVLERPATLPVWLAPQIFKERPAAAETKPAPSPRTLSTARRPFTLARTQPAVAIPRNIDMAPDAPVITGTATGAPGGEPVFGFLPAVAAPPAPTPVPPGKPAPALPLMPIRVSGGVQSAKLIFGPKPPYPPLAKTARVQGTVRIQAIIGRDGRIRNLQVLSGPPLLVEAAKDAVSQWRYQPTLLNTEAVEVITEIDVNFAFAP